MEKMRIGVISDTHILSLSSAVNLAEQLLDGPFSEVDAILHAGDHIFEGLSDCFDPIPWYSVRGNMDASHAMFPIQRIVTISQVRIGMVHGWGPVKGIEECVQSCFDPAEIDVLVFGHSHQPVCRWYGSVLLFNPGSAMDRRSAPNHTVGILTLGSTVSGEIIIID